MLLDAVTMSLFMHRRSRIRGDPVLDADCTPRYDREQLCHTRFPTRALVYNDHTSVGGFKA